MLEKNDLDFSMHEYYERRAPEYDDWYNRAGRYNDPATNAAWHAQVAELGREAAHFGGQLARRPQTYALEIACGTGKWTPYFVHSLQSTGRLVACDYSPAMLEVTRERLTDDDPENLGKTIFVRGDAYRLPFADGVFDFVFFGFWLSHVPLERVQPFLAEVKRVMKPGANLLIFDSAYEASRPAQSVDKRPLKDGSSWDVLKIRYTPQQLEETLAKVFPSVSARQTREYFVIGQAFN
jgi:ubiquinone/menaquinone biosynthesis C-methylase UbiE